MNRTSPDTPAVSGWMQSAVMQLRRAPVRCGVFRIIWIVLLAIVIIGSVLPSNSGIMKAVDTLPVSDKFEHSAAYAALAFVPTLHERARKLRLVLIAVSALGVLLEFAQLYSPGRTCDVYDALADWLGVGVGLFAGLPLRALIRNFGVAKSSV